MACIIAISTALGLFSQMPSGAKENFHVRIAQENRFYISKCKVIYMPTETKWSNIMRSSGKMVELAYKGVTIASTFLTDYHKTGGTNKIDLDFGYEHNLTKSLKIHPFVGCEFNENGTGLSMGSKLNKNFDIFDYISIGVFAGLRYSESKDIINLNNRPYYYTNYFSASLGAYFLIYDYKRPKINRNW